MTGKPPFESVVSVHGSTVLRVCRAVLGPADADDAWSETFLSALKAYPDLPADANVEAWLVTIAHRKAIDVTRAAARRAIPVAETPEALSPISAAAGSQAPGSQAPGGQVSGSQAAGSQVRGGLVADDDLADALTRLPAKQKQAVAYHYLAGLPYADIAAILGGTAEAARRAAADGIARLRRSYSGAGAGAARAAPSGTACGAPPSSTAGGAAPASAAGGAVPPRTDDRPAGRPPAPRTTSKDIPGA